MKMKFYVPLVFLFIPVAACSSNLSVSKEVIPFINQKGEELFNNEIVTFSDVKAVRYISLEDAYNLNKYFQRNHLFGGEYDFSIDNNKDTVTLNNGVTIKYDVMEDTITFSDHYLGVYYRETLLSDYEELEPIHSENVKMLCSTTTGNIRYRNTSETKISLKEYGFDLKKYDGHIYVPFAIHNDIFLSPSGYPCSLLKNIIYSRELGTSGIKDKIKENALDINSDLLDYNYRETCFNMDLNYGLKEEHHITSFDTCFTLSGRKQKMLDNVDDYEVALSEFIGYSIDDIHSIFASSSPSAESTHLFTQGLYAQYHTSIVIKMMFDRQTALPNLSPYEEIGNTAFITLDNFKPLNASKGIPTTITMDSPAQDVITYSYDKIVKGNKKNIVIDITNNGGGDVETLCYLISLISGTTNQAIIRNTVDDSVLVTTFGADANLDHVYNVDDKQFADKNIYILMCNASFSAANMLPNFLKGASNVTLIGKQSGGGACAVQYCTNVVGSSYNISSSLKFSTIYNGSYRSCDNGATPDINVDYSLFYKRADLMNFLNIN